MKKDKEQNNDTDNYNKKIAFIIRKLIIKLIITSIKKIIIKIIIFIITKIIINIIIKMMIIIKLKKNYYGDNNRDNEN